MVLFCLISCLVVRGYAQQAVLEYGNYTIRHYTEADGLASTACGNVYRDHYGFIWISGFSGISRFDGRTFVKYTMKDGLGGNATGILGESKEGMLYLATITGVYHYTGNASHPFVRYAVSGGVLAAACPADSGNVWVSYGSEPGIDLVSPTRHLYHISCDGPVMDMQSDRKGVVYVMQYNGKLWALQHRKLKPVGILNKIKPYINEGQQMHIDPDNNVWVFAANNKFIYKLSPTGFADSIQIPANSNFWEWRIGVNKNLYRIASGNNVLKKQAGQWQPDIPGSVLDGVVYTVTEYDEHTRWIADQSGLYKVTRKNYTTIDPTHRLQYLGTGAGHRTIFRADSQLCRLPGAWAFAKKVSPNLSSTYIAQDKRVFYCTDSGLFELKARNEPTLIHGIRRDPFHPFYYRFIRPLEDPSGGIWISTFTGMVYYKDGRFTYHFIDDWKNDGAMYTIAMNKDGDFFASGKSIYVFKDTTFINLSDRLGLQKDITRLCTDRRGCLWACQGSNRLYKLEKSEGGLYVIADTLIPQMNGKEISPVFFNFDSANNLWLTNGSSLFAYTPDAGGKYHSEQYRYFDEHLANDASVQADDSGNIYLYLKGGHGYIRTYKAADLLRNKVQPPDIYLTGLQLFNKIFDWGKSGIRTGEFGMPVQPELTSRQNFLKFLFTAIPRGNSEYAVYRYMLDGYDKLWSPVSERGEAAYTGLPPGKYVFKVQAADANGSWSKVLTYPLRILPPWYSTWWAWMLWLTGSALSIWLLFMLRLRSVRRKADFERMVVEEKLKALRAQINPHFLQNTFEFLTYQINTLPKEEAIDTMHDIAAYLRKVLYISDQSVLSLEDELAFIEEYLRVQQKLLSTAFSYQVDVADDVDTFDIQVPAMFLQTIVENALKYGLRPDAPNLVRVTVEQKADIVQCTISDTGGGRTASPKPDGYISKGLELTFNRLKLLYKDSHTPPTIKQLVNVHGGWDVSIHIPLK